MTLHPKERGATRRDFLIRSGGAALGLSGAGSLLAACSNSTTPGGGSSVAGKAPVGPGGLPLARPDKRVTLPLWKDPIASGLKPETGGTFTIFNYPNYLYTKLFKEFCAKYDVTPQYTAFDNIASGIQRLASGSVEPGRDGDDARQPRPGRRRPADQPAQPGLHPQPEEERLATAREPVLRLGVALHRPVHHLRDGHLLAQRPRHRGHRRHAAAVGHLLAVPGVQRQDRAPLRGPRDDRDGAPAQGHHRHQHRGPEAREPGGGRPEAALQHLQHQGRRLPVPDRSPRGRRGSTRPGRATRSRPTSTTCPRARPRA